MDRKEFLLSSALAAISVTTLGCVIERKSVVPELPDSTHSGDCETTDDILGPFYRSNAPKRSDMTFEGLEGSRVLVKGTVYTDDCTTAVKDATIEIWHCDTEGNYDNKSDDYLHRAQQSSDENGTYSFHTILPGKYLNGALYRPAHMHFRVTHEDHKELVSQIYFTGDPHIAKDPWASKKKAEARILPVVLEDTKGNLAVTFDIYLAKV